MDAVLPYSAKYFSHAVVMPNLAKPITTISLAEKYRGRIEASLDRHKFSGNFTPLMTCYLTDDVDAGEVEKGFSAGVFRAVKMYPAHATTHSKFGLTDFFKPDSLYRMMSDCGMPLLIHGELSDPDIDIYDREKLFIDKVLNKIIDKYPKLKIVLEHITTRDAVDFILASKHANIAATITPHHLWINRSDMFAGGKVHPHLFCLPIAKREIHRQALIQAAISGDARFFAGTDSAPHARGDKESTCGCAGIFNAPTALLTYAEVFDNAGKLDKLSDFVDKFGSDFYNLSHNSDSNDTITLIKEPARIEESIKIADGQEIMVFRGGEETAWQYAA